MDVLGEKFWVLQIPAPVEIVVAFEEFGGGTIWNSDVPELFSVADYICGCQTRSESVPQILAGFHNDICQDEFAEDAVGDGVEGVLAGADVGDCEFSVRGAVDPEFVVFGVVLPIYRSWAEAAEATARCGVIGCG